MLFYFMFLINGNDYMQTTASESGLFDHLINVWEFKPGPVPGTCDLYFLVDFKFQSPLYRQVNHASSDPAHLLGYHMPVMSLTVRHLSHLRLHQCSSRKLFHD